MNLKGRRVKSAREPSKPNSGQLNVIAFNKAIESKPASPQAAPKIKIAYPRASSSSEEQVSKPILALRSYLVERYATGDLYGTDVAELAWHLTQCNLPFADLATNPNEPSFAANASRKVQKCLGFGAVQESFSRLQVPASCLETGTRVWKEFQCLSIAEALSQEFISRPEQIINSLSCFDSENWRENRHRQAGEVGGDINIPCGIFIDGAAWAGKGAGTRESVVAMYVNILGELGP